MSRSASPSIRGYNYQFLKSINEILNAAQDGIIQLECVEDIDILSPVASAFVQVKYLESKKLVASSVLEPIALMLDDYICNKAKRGNAKYKIYAHFGDDTGNTDFLKKENFLTLCKDKLKALEKTSEASLDQATLDTFLNQFHLEIGVTFDEMEKKTLETIAQHFNVDTAHAELYLYPNALNLMYKLSGNPKEIERRISKINFLAKINTKNQLYGVWQKIELGELEYIKKLKKQISPQFQNVKRRLIYLDCQSIKADSTGYGLHQLVHDLFNKYRLFEKLYNTTPLSFILNCAPQDLLRLKQYLLENDIKFNDGFENISFSPKRYNESPITNLKLMRYIDIASYELKLTSLTTHLSFIDKIDHVHTEVFVSKDVPFNTGDTVRFHLEGIETYSQIHQVLI